MLSLEQITDRLSDRILATVAKETGLTYMTVWKVRNRKQDNFSYATVKALSDYLEERP
jgi:hypothetical protein